eukprot:TRINITY_DN11980_c0_g1_i3.p3 TRINITY_DN11980_c0_g1~~TRINITY_DN11980_c0_g1_i3.p3  ORF type:complete len:100 (+),score=20.02 TRINITY_DN11980_c0_g1_i3:38-337(+)
MSAAYLDFLGSVAARRRKAASRQAVGSCVANLQLLEWLLVLRRRTGNTPNLPDVPRKLAKAGDSAEPEKSAVRTGGNFWKRSPICIRLEWPTATSRWRT